MTTAPVTFPAPNLSALVIHGPYTGQLVTLVESPKCFPDNWRCDFQGGPAKRVLIPRKHLAPASTTAHSFYSA